MRLHIMPIPFVTAIAGLMLFLLPVSLMASQSSAEDDATVAFGVS